MEGAVDSFEWKDHGTCTQEGRCLAPLLALIGYGAGWGGSNVRTTFTTGSRQPD